MKKWLRPLKVRRRKSERGKGGKVKIMAAPFKGKRGKSERGKGEKVKKWLRLLTGEQVNSPNRQTGKLISKLTR